MINASMRPKKDPESVRRRLLSSTANLLSERGFAGVNVSDIASGAGVTKGGLFHHFPSKHEIIAAVFDAELEQLSLLIDELMSQDTGNYGRFTRAYIRATFLACADKGSSSALTLSLCAEPELVSRWEKWLDERLEQNRHTDFYPELEIARFAADGIWFTNLLKIRTPANSESLLKLQDMLLKMTLKGADSGVING